MNFLIRMLTWWNSQTLGRRSSRRVGGIKVGEDAQGNIYYRNADDSRRWVIYNGDIEATRVNPDWHGWLHHTWDKPPTEAPLPKKGWEKPHLENLTGTPAAYAPPGSIRRAEPAVRRDYERGSPSNGRESDRGAGRRGGADRGDRLRHLCRQSARVSRAMAAATR